MVHQGLKVYGIFVIPDIAAFTTFYDFQIITSPSFYVTFRGIIYFAGR
jgi:hypothetical protein